MSCDFKYATTAVSQAGASQDESEASLASASKESTKVDVSGQGSIALYLLRDIGTRCFRSCVCCFYSFVGTERWRIMRPASALALQWRGYACLPAFVRTIPLGYQQRFARHLRNTLSFCLFVRPRLGIGRHRPWETKSPDRALGPFLMDNFVLILDEQPNWAGRFEYLQIDHGCREKIRSH
jgi:hypothetical protein